MGKFYVYEHWRPDRESPFYVGKGTGRRAWSFQGRRGYPEIAKELARSGLMVEVRIVADCLKEKLAFILEMERVAFWRSRGAELMNRTNGGDGSWGAKVSLETRTKMSEALRSAWASGDRQPISDETKAKIAATLAGRQPSDETRTKLCAAQRTRQAEGRGTRLSDEARAKISAGMKGRKMFDETRAKIAATMKGRRFSEEHRMALSASQKGRQFMPEHRARATEALRSPEVRARLSAAAKAREAARKGNGL